MAPADTATATGFGTGSVPTSFGEDIVTLSLPASGEYLSVLRTATAGLAARLDFTLDEIEDLRIAVDEACAMLLPDAMAGSDLRCHFTLADGWIGVDVSVDTVAVTPPSRETFAWMVLSALSGDVASMIDDGRLRIQLSKHRREQR